MQHTSPEELIAQLKSADDAVRGAAWQGASPVGAAAIQPLAALMSDENFETARTARRALAVIVRHAGRPGGRQEARAVAAQLAALLSAHPVAVRREALWLLSEIGDNDAVAPMAKLLDDSDLRDDARATLLRIPGRKSTAALTAAFERCPDDFKFALADSLRLRRETVPGFASRKLVPTKPTTVTASAATNAG